MASIAKPLIVIVEDEKDLAALISEQLIAAGMHTQVFYRANQVIPYLRRHYVNLLLLDINLPDQSGFSLVEEMKESGLQVPLIFLTASTSEMSKVRGLELGGDDYVTKPFSFPELIARIKAVLRRTETARDLLVTPTASLSQDPFDFCGAAILPQRLEIRFPNGQVKTLGRKELGILTCLAQNRGTVLSRRRLIHAVWGDHADVRSRSLDQYIVKLRGLFEENQCSIEHFRTVHGVGYIYELETGGSGREAPPPADFKGTVST